MANSSQQQRSGRLQNQQLSSPANRHWAVHNDGNQRAKLTPAASGTSTPPDPAAIENGPRPSPPYSSTAGHANGTGSADPQFSSSTIFGLPEPPITPLSERQLATSYFSAQSYLRYQGDKFVKRFDSNCYIALTRKLDTHDVSWNRVDPQSRSPVADALAMLEQPALIIGIESDGLFTFAEQQELAAGIPNARLRTIDSPEGHDAFLLQFKQVNRHILEFLHEVLPDIWQRPVHADAGIDAAELKEALDGGKSTLTKGSVFGEAEPDSVDDITTW